MRCVVACFLRAPTCDNFEQTRLSSLKRSNLSFKIRLPFFVAAHVRENQLHHVIANFAAARQMDWGNTHAFTINVGRQPHRTRRRAADVGVVGSVGYEEQGSGIWGQGPVLSLY